MGTAIDLSIVRPQPESDDCYITFSVPEMESFGLALACATANAVRLQDCVSIVVVASCLCTSDDC